MRETIAWFAFSFAFWPVNLPIFSLVALAGHQKYSALWSLDWLDQYGTDLTIGTYPNPNTWADTTSDRLAVDLANGTVTFLIGKTEIQTVALDSGKGR